MCSRSSARSPGDLEPVFQAMLANATQICEAEFRHSDTYTRTAPFAASRSAMPPPHLQNASGARSFIRQPGQRSGRMSPEPNRSPHRRISGPRSHTSRASQARRRSPILAALARAHRSDAQGRRAGRRQSSIYRQEVRPVYRQADRVGPELRRAGRHRHREHPAAERTARIPCSSRPRPPTCSKSSAVRRSICRRVLDTLVEVGCSLVRGGTWSVCFVVDGEIYKSRALTITIRANSGNFTKVIPSRQGGGPPWAVWRSKAEQFKLSTF